MDIKLARSQAERFARKTERRRDAVKHMKARVTHLNREFRTAPSLKEADAILDKIEFLNSVITKTVDNLNPKRKLAKSIAAHSDDQNGEDVHLYNNDHSSLVGASALFSATA